MTARASLNQNYGTNDTQYLNEHLKVSLILFVSSSKIKRNCFRILNSLLPALKQKEANEHKITIFKSITFQCDWCVWSFDNTKNPKSIAQHKKKTHKNFTKRFHIEKSLITWNLNTMGLWRDKRFVETSRRKQKTKKSRNLRKKSSSSSLR